MSERRTLLLIETLRIVAKSPEPSRFTAVFGAVLQRDGRPEEECGPEIHAAMSLLVRRRIIDCSTRSPDGSLTFGAETRLAPSQATAFFIWNEVWASDPIA